jgi:membrane-bound hydrogenase subunit alpha
VPKDIRQDHAYAAYADVGVRAITPDQLTGAVNGDVYDRVIVRLLEVKQSIDIIRACLANLPRGDILSIPKVPRLLATLKKASGEGIGRHEAPRGEVFHYIMLEAGEEAPYAWKARAPTYNNLRPWVPMLLGQQIADIPIVVASTDPCLSCTNRVVLVDERGRRKTMTWEKLHELSVRKTRRLMRDVRG